MKRIKLEGCFELEIQNGIFNIIEVDRKIKIKLFDRNAEHNSIVIEILKTNEHLDIAFIENLFNNDKKIIITGLIFDEQGKATVLRVYFKKDTQCIEADRKIKIFGLPQKNSHLAYQENFLIDMFQCVLSYEMHEKTMDMDNTIISFEEIIL